MPISKLLDYREILEQMKVYSEFFGEDAQKWIDCGVEHINVSHNSMNDVNHIYNIDPIESIELRNHKDEVVGEGKRYLDGSIKFVYYVDEFREAIKRANNGR